MRKQNKALHVAFVLLFLLSSVLLLADARPGSNQNKPSKASNLVKIKLVMKPFPVATCPQVCMRNPNTSGSTSLIN